MKKLLLVPLFSLLIPGETSFAQTKETKMKALIVVTSNNQMGTTGKQTGYYLPEVSHPFLKLIDQGIQVDIASPKGGKAPMDEGSRDLTDPANKRFLDNKLFADKLDHTLKLSEVKSSEYQAILFAGGHGTMWDFAQTPALNTVAESIYLHGGIVAAFSNAEEEAAGLTKVMPFLLETELTAKGAVSEKAGLWQKKVVVSERLITGQNPASAEGVGEEIAKMMKKLK